MQLLLPWFILLLPLLSSALIGLVISRWKTLSSILSVAACAGIFAISLGLTFGLIPPSAATIDWIAVGKFTLSFGLKLDSLARTMLLVVTGVGFLIHLYSLEYMRGDSGKSRFFAALSLFMFSMCGLVMSDNFVMMFIFWELVGVSSYLLIGHWFVRDAAADAANKAFLANRIGDFGFMIGILLLWSHLGTLAFDDLGNFATRATDPGMQIILGIALVLVFCGAVGKSAQVPLHVWLPDAMEGPTPVSALIHAATMVAAGVYMLVRISPLVEVSPLWATETIAWVGLITAVLAALMATQQDDIKRILAYSTLSQLGYMIMAVGLLAGNVAMFHLYTHAFFKALLFLGAGAVIHSMHHEQNIWQMGGLAKRMPITALTFLIGTLALAGVPMFSGAFSKHDILAAAHAKNPTFFWTTAAVALLTTFYMFRLVFTVFPGKERSSAAERAHEASPLMIIPLVVLAVPSIVAAYPFFKRAFPFFDHNAVAHSNHRVGHAESLEKIAEIGHNTHSVPAIVDFASGGAIAVGFVLALILYWNKTKDVIRIPILAERFYIDAFYKSLIRCVQDGLATLTGWIDRWLIDGVFVRGLAAGVWLFGFVARFLQVGNLQAYNFFFGAGIVILLYLIFNL